MPLCRAWTPFGKYIRKRTSTSETATELWLVKNLTVKFHGHQFKTDPPKGCQVFGGP